MIFTPWKVLEIVDNFLESVGQEVDWDDAVEIILYYGDDGQELDGDTMAWTDFSAKLHEARVSHYQ